MFIAAIKFVLGVLLLPVVIAVTEAFHGELRLLTDAYEQFVCGAGVFLISYLFVYTFEGIYQFGQRIAADVFRFSSPIASVIPQAIPFLTCLILLTLYILTTLDVRHLSGYFMAVAGFTLALHVILTAKEIHGTDANHLKPDYVFSMSLIYIVNIVVVALLLDLNFAKFSFPSMTRSAWKIISEIYLLVYHRLVV